MKRAVCRKATCAFLQDQRRFEAWLRLLQHAVVTRSAAAFVKRAVSGIFVR
jgi:hypothetical protein